MKEKINENQNKNIKNAHQQQKLAFKAECLRFRKEFNKKQQKNYMSTKCVFVLYGTNHSARCISHIQKEEEEEKKRKNGPANQEPTVFVHFKEPARSQSTRH